MLSITSHQKGVDKGMMRCYFTPTKVLLATGQVTVAASQDVERAELCVAGGGVQWGSQHRKPPNVSSVVQYTVTYDPPFLPQGK